MPRRMLRYRSEIGHSYPHIENALRQSLKELTAVLLNFQAVSDLTIWLDEHKSGVHN
ncbi:MAG: hypothetical protein Kow0065_23140 [Methylomicrobium sp.]